MEDDEHDQEPEYNERVENPSPILVVGPDVAQLLDIRNHTNKQYKNGKPSQSRAQ